MVPRCDHLRQYHLQHDDPCDTDSQREQDEAEALVDHSQVQAADGKEI